MVARGQGAAHDDGDGDGGIYVIDGGRILESGRHDELLDNRGYYAELERVQREGGEEDDLERLRVSS